MTGFYFKLPISTASALGLLLLGLSNEASLYSAFGGGLLLACSIAFLVKAYHTFNLTSHPA